MAGNYYYCYLLLLLLLLRRKKCVHCTLIILALSATFSFHSEANLHNPLWLFSIPHSVCILVPPLALNSPTPPFKLFVMRTFMDINNSSQRSLPFV